MLGLRERMEDNDTAPPPREAERSAAAPPDLEVVDKPSRRRFSPSYKLRIVEEADACTESGAVGRLLWREAARSGSLKALSQKRGRKPERNPFADRMRKLERENVRLERELHKARLI